ncbi:unnamed protein product [Spirodela intermedia]|uniref:Uncharacterized protein n=1 Tax=Spirodela intermedia TaxID=51605 RepID=A0A7I8IAT1_SPIIN|nr:unnamed protein product [Spirodela intermedia]CAA6654795.1 unnamed protein product [Spirodela intermedia]
MSSAVREGVAWEEDLGRLVPETGIQYTYAGDDGLAGVGVGYGGAAEVKAVGGGNEDRYPAVDGLAGAGLGYGGEGSSAAEESLKDQVEGFLKASGELLVELGRSCKDIALQTLEGMEDSHVGRNMRSACVFAASRLGFLNEYLPEDRDPVHAWPVIIFVSSSLSQISSRYFDGKPSFKEFWERNMEESVRQGDSKPFVEEAILQVSSWGFNLAELQAPKNPEREGLLNWLKSFYSLTEREWTGFTGPIHIWQVCAAVDYRLCAARPAAATVHKLPGEGHFSYFCFCDECHRHIFSTILGTPRGPLDTMAEDQTASDAPLRK